MATETIRVGSRGTVVLPAQMRRAYGLEDGSTALVEEREEGILIRPAVVLPVERYAPERKAAFLLSGALDVDEYASAVREVLQMGLDPGLIPHTKPPGIR